MGHSSLSYASEAVPLPASDGETRRLAALDDLDIMDTPREEAFDRITRLAKKVFHVPYVYFNMIDGHRTYGKSVQGLDFAEAPRHLSFCQHTIRQQEPLIVPDARADERFAANPYVLGNPNIRFYAGVPIQATDGHNVGTLCVVDDRPRDFSREQVEMLQDLARMAGDELTLRQAVATDSLTGALSRRAFKEQARQMASLAVRHKHELSCLALDIDHFKTINDSFGHSAGDRVLVEVMAACRRQLRATDPVGRLGGEEFAILLPQTSRPKALLVAEKIRMAIEALSIASGPVPISVTVSLGAASIDRMTRDADSLLKHADEALYEAKAAGRNRSVLWKSAGQDEVLAGRRVFKGGQIFFNGRTSVLDCTVRVLSDSGAGIQVSDTVGLPKTFDLSIKADGFEKPCRILKQAEKYLEVEFC